MDNLKVRQAFALAVDRDALAAFRKTTEPLIDFTPKGLFPEYEKIRTEVYKRELAKVGSSIEEWQSRKFDPAKARKLSASSAPQARARKLRRSCHSDRPMVFARRGRRPPSSSTSSKATVERTAAAQGFAANIGP